MSIKKARSLRFVIIKVIYVLAFAVGLLEYRSLSDTGWNFLWQLFFDNAAATVVVLFIGPPICFIGVSLMEKRQLWNRPGHANVRNVRRCSSENAKC